MPEIGAPTTINPVFHSIAANGRDSQDPAQTPYASPNVDWTELVSRIRQGEQEATADLYQIFARGVRSYLTRQLGVQDVDDKVHDIFLIVVQAIRRGSLRQPERLMGYVRTIVRYQVSAYIYEATHRRREHQADSCPGSNLIDHAPNPEQSSIQQQHRQLVLSILHKMPMRDREILTRFYLDEQPLQQICQEMHLTDTQFRLFKSRAKARFAEVGRKKLQRPIVGISETLPFLTVHSEICASE